MKLEPQKRKKREADLTHQGWCRW